MKIRGLQDYMERIDRFSADLSENNKRWCETAVDPFRGTKKELLCDAVATLSWLLEGSS